MQKLKKPVNDVCKQIIKANKPKNIEILENIQKDLISAYDKFTAEVRKGYEDLTADSQQKRDSIFKAVRERTQTAFTTLQLHAASLKRGQTDEAIIERLTKLSKHFEVPEVIGSAINLEKPPTIDFSDEEPDSDDETVTGEDDETEDDMAFDLKTAVALIPTYDGKPETLTQFVDSVELLTTLTPNTQTDTLLKFVKTRLIGKARDVAQGAEDIEEILRKIKQHCGSTTTSDSLKAKLMACRQHNNAAGFVAEVEKLTSQLAAQYLFEGIPPDAARKLAETAGVEAVKKGTKNPQMKLILTAGTFNTLAEATTKLLKEDNASPHIISNILRMRHDNNRGRGRGQFNNNTRGGYQNNGNRGNYSNNNQRRPNNNYNNYNNGNNSNNRQNNNRRNDNRHVRITQSEDFLEQHPTNNNTAPTSQRHPP